VLGRGCFCSWGASFVCWVIVGCVGVPLYTSCVLRALYAFLIKSSYLSKKN
jgi:hypothetical protein